MLSTRSASGRFATLSLHGNFQVSTNHGHPGGHGCTFPLPASMVKTSPAFLGLGLALRGSRNRHRRNLRLTALRAVFHGVERRLPQGATVYLTGVSPELEGEPCEVMAFQTERWGWDCGKTEWEWNWNVLDFQQIIDASLHHGTWHLTSLFARNYWLVRFLHPRFNGQSALVPEECLNFGYCVLHLDEPNHWIDGASGSLTFAVFFDYYWLLMEEILHQLIGWLFRPLAFHTSQVVQDFHQQYDYECYKFQWSFQQKYSSAIVSTHPKSKHT